MRNRLVELLKKWASAEVFCSPVSGGRGCAFGALYVALLMLPELCFKYICPMPFDFMVRNVMFHTGFAYIVCLIAYLFACNNHRKIADAVYYSVAAVIGVLSIVDTFLLVFFYTGICPQNMMLLLETNANEAAEFLQVYASRFRFWVIIGVYAMTAVMAIAVLPRLLGLIRRYKRHVCMIAALPLAICVLAFVVKSPIVFKKESYHVTDNGDGNYSGDVALLQSTVLRVMQCYAMITEYPNVIKRCYAENKAIQIDSCAFRSPNIILVIGESYNKHHSSLYGYAKDTNPLLEKRRDIELFTNVVTSMNSTHISLRNMFSLASVEDGADWYERPLILGVMKKAGYNVVLYSNQLIDDESSQTDIWSYLGGFWLFEKDIKPLLISSGNNEKYQFDGDFVDDWVAHRASHEKDSANFIVFQLAGQHLKPSERFPASYAYFTADSVERNDLNQEQRQEVADYDNATRYNDMVVNRIFDLYADKDALVIYVSDHGDEVNDFRPSVGRRFDFATQEGTCAHQQLDIPFIVYMSPLYRERHPDVVKAIDKAKSRPFMTDDLPHVLMDLAGIKTRWYEPSRSVINDSYNERRERLIVANGKTYNYDKNRYQ